MQKQYFVHGLYSPMSFGDRPVYRSLQNDDIWIFKFQLTLSSSGSLSLGHMWGFCFHPFVRRKHEHWRARVLTFSRIPLTTRQKSNLPLCTLQMFFCNSCNYCMSMSSCQFVDVYLWYLQGNFRSDRWQ